MRYSFEFKKKCVEMYKKGIYPETPDGVSTKTFKNKIRHWVLLVEHYGIDILKTNQCWKKWSTDEKLVLVNKCLAGNSINSIGIIEGINPSIIFKWVYNYQKYGYNGLIEKKKGNIHSQSLIHMCPGFWVHISNAFFIFLALYHK